MSRLIRCLQCDELFMQTPFDQSPEYKIGSESPFSAFETLPRDDFGDFLKNHHGHSMEELEIIADSFVSEEAYLEPVNTSCFRATNGSERFVIKRYRDKIDEPLRYELIHGDYSLQCVAIEIQSEAISKQLRSEFIPEPLSDAEISSFLKLWRSVCERVDIKTLEWVDYESSHSLEGYHKLDEVSFVYLLRNCRNIFKGKKFLAIDDFIKRNAENGVLLIKAKYAIQIVKRRVQKKEARSPVSSAAKLKKALTNKK
jgi:hypothetical protein